MKQVIWKQYSIGIKEISKFLTTYNFQPGKFILVADPLHPTEIIVIAVSEE